MRDHTGISHAVWQQYKKFLPLLLPYALIGTLIVKGIYLGCGPLIAATHDFLSWVGLLSFIMQTMIIMVLWHTMTIVTHAIISHDPHILGRIQASLPSILLGALAYSLLLYLGTLFVFVWVYLIVVLWFYPIEAALAPKKGVRFAFGQSYALVANAWWRTAGKIVSAIFIPLFFYLFIKANLPLSLHSLLDILAYSLFLPWALLVTLAIHHEEPVLSAKPPTHSLCLPIRLTYVLSCMAKTTASVNIFLFTRVSCGQWLDLGAHPKGGPVGWHELAWLSADWHHLFF